jgi:ADP-ribosylglycohydrolase
MRAAPIGGYFAGQPERAAQEARLSALVTHWHPEGQAGAMAVVSAAAIAVEAGAPSGVEFLRAVASCIPQGPTKERILEAVEIPPDDLPGAIRRLGTGQWVTAQDTVPFCLWVAAHYLGNYEEALWRTVEGGGDADTTCAIVGGIVALSAREIPSEWLARREPLPPL